MKMQKKIQFDFRNDKKMDVILRKCCTDDFRALRELSSVPIMKPLHI